MCICQKGALLLARCFSANYPLPSIVEFGEDLKDKAIGKQQRGMEVHDCQPAWSRRHMKKKMKGKTGTEDQCVVLHDPVLCILLAIGNQHSALKFSKL